MKLGVTQRLYAGFACLFFVLVVLVWVNERALQASGSAQQNYETAAQHRDDVQSLGQIAAELQRRVQLYGYAGHDATPERVRELLDELENGIARLADEADEELLERLSSHVSEYRNSFSLAVEERALRTELVQEIVPTLERDISSAIPGSSQSFELFSAQRLNLRQYLIDPEFSLLTSSTDALRELDAPTEVRDTLQRHVDVFTRIVQATRGYLFLINVVLAGQSMEFAYTLGELETSSRQRIATTSQSVAVTVRNARRASWVLAVGGLLFGLVLAVLIGRSISRPLGAITRTLRQLGEGARGVSVPGVERADEIGVMARAANVFREQNERTAELLDETRRLAESLDEHKGQLERSNDELEQFVHTVSHDLKSPLVTIAGFLGIMKELASRGEVEAALSKMGKLERSHQRMNQLIDDLLDLSRVGRTDIERTEIQLETVVGELLDEMRRRHPDAHFECGALPTIQGNESRVLQVLENLVGNAIKYAGESATVTVTAEEKSEGVVLTVEDDGPGISPEHHEHVFGLFQRLDRTQKGTGVGLAIVRRIMKFHQGRVWIDSSGDGLGTKFNLLFPVNHD